MKIFDFLFAGWKRNWQLLPHPQTRQTGEVGAGTVSYQITQNPGVTE